MTTHANNSSVYQISGLHWSYWWIDKFTLGFRPDLARVGPTVAFRKSDEVSSERERERARGSYRASEAFSECSTKTSNEGWRAPSSLSLSRFCVVSAGPYRRWGNISPRDRQENESAYEAFYPFRQFKIQSLSHISSDRKEDRRDIARHEGTGGRGGEIYWGDLDFGVVFTCGFHLTLPSFPPPPRSTRIAFQYTTLFMSFDFIPNIRRRFPSQQAFVGRLFREFNIVLHL